MRHKTDCSFFCSYQTPTAGAKPAIGDEYFVVAKQALLSSTVLSLTPLWRC